jgi:hypothetical protein
MDAAYRIGFAHGALCCAGMLLSVAALLAICWLIRYRHWLSDEWSFGDDRPAAQFGYAPCDAPRRPGDEGGRTGDPIPPGGL